ncbi:Hint domain-containing protein [Acidisoma cellulosilytica]|uniref:Hint domain-containing protein n=1 Tax=Acidisoma cellulosilyticum TaxID=2802395 RepID=A0A963Z0F4_9PROT|nr:Hint domain-containing protein [Acidisoma cellulosilyticum]MCB8879717.1 Hint domain-containing protein [Acidisoma cellulosilyticum]
MVSDTILSGGTEFVGSGTFAAYNDVQGTEVIDRGASSFFDTVSAGGTYIISSGGSARAIQDVGAEIIVSSGGYISAAGVTSSAELGAATMTVLAGGTAVEIGLLGGEDIVFGETSGSDLGQEERDSPATLATEIVESGGTAIDTHIGYQFADNTDTSGFEEVKSGGVTSGSVIQSGSESVLSGGIAYATSGGDGDMTVFAGGTSVDAVFGFFSDAGLYPITYGGGTMYLAGGISSDTMLFDSTEIVESSNSGKSAGTAISTVISVWGSLIVGEGTAVGTVISSGGSLIVSGGTAIDTTIKSGGTAILDQGAVVQSGIVFSGGAADLVVSGTDMPATPISGFGLTDGIDLASVIYANNGTASFSDGILTVKEGNASYDLSLAGDYDNATFSLTRDSLLGTEIMVASLACFAAGTHIATEHGEVAIETIAIDDVVRTADGELQPVIWIGHRHVDCGRHPEPASILPVLITAHAFALNEPKRDLFLSPDHAVFQDGMLIPVKYLINGTTIRQIKTDRLTYFHIELARHAVILAEGLPAESYLDTGDRASFVDGSVTRLHPHFGGALQDSALVMEALAFAPLRVTGPEVERVRARLAARVLTQRATG